VANLDRKAWGPFIAPQGNLAVGGVRDPDISGSGPDMFGQPLYNPAWGLDKAGLTWDNADRLDMSELGVRHVWDNSRKLR
jgi:hypothetical protein